MDFSALLSTIGKGDTEGFVDLATKKRKNAPPPVSLTPSQTAIGDIVAGAQSAHQPDIVHSAPPSAHPSMSGTDRAMGALSALAQPVQRTPDPEIAPVQIYQNAPMAAYQDEPVNLRPNIPKFALGGVLGDDQEAIVGDDGPEHVKVVNGKAIVTPIPKEDQPIVAAQPTVQTQVENRPTTFTKGTYMLPWDQYTDQQSANDAMVQTGTRQAPTLGNLPDATMGSGRDVNHPEVAGGTEDVAPPQTAASRAASNVRFDQTDAYKHPKTLEDWKAKETFDSDKNNVQKQSFWKDFGSKLILGANAFFNPQNAQPIVGWGEYKRKQALAQDQAQVNRLMTTRGEEAKQQKVLADAQESQAQAVQRLADAEHQRKADETAGNKWTWKESNGLIYKLKADGSTEPWIDPNTGTQGVNKTGVPIERLLSDGTKVFQTGPQAATTDAAQVEANAKRVQSTQEFNFKNRDEVEKWNAENKLKVDLANQQSTIGWQKDTLDKQIKALEAGSDVFAKSEEAKGLNNEVQTLASVAGDIQTRFAKAEADKDTDEQAKLQKEMDDVIQKMGGLQSKIGAVMGAQGKSAQLASILQQSKRDQPKTVKFTPRKYQGDMQPVQTGGKVAHSADVDRYAASKNWTRKQAESYLKSQGYTIQ